VIAVVDGLKGFPEAITAVFPDTIVQTCIVHLIRYSYAVRVLEGAQAHHCRAQAGSLPLREAYTDISRRICPAFTAVCENNYAVCAILFADGALACPQRHTVTTTMRQSEIEEKLKAPNGRVRVWIRELEPLRSKPRSERSVTSFSIPEALFMAVIWRLEKAGVRAEALTVISRRMYGVICRPQPVRERDLLTLYQTEDGAWHLEDIPGVPTVQVTVPVWVCRQALAMSERAEVLIPQRELLPPSPVSSRRASRR
jgi:hypothetical protein